MRDTRFQVQVVSTYPSNELRSWIRAEPTLNTGTQWRLVRHPRVRVRTALAEHRSVSGVHQSILAADPNQYVRRELAGNLSLTSEAADQLVDDDAPAWHEFVVKELARNPAVSVGTLERIHREHALGRAWVPLLANERFPLEHFEPIEELTNMDQFILAKRPGLPVGTMVRLRTAAVHPLHLSRFLIRAGCSDDAISAGQNLGTGTLVGETLEDVQRIDRLPGAALEAARVLSDGWTGTLDELLRASEQL